MQKLKFISALAFLILLTAGDSLCQESKPAPSQLPNTSVEIPESRNQIIKFTDSGVTPPELKIKREDSIVFFLNDSNDSLTSLVIEFGEKATHCGSAKMRTGKGGRVATARPFGPNDFASTCFHESGEYPFTVYGLKPNRKGISSTIYVE